MKKVALRILNRINKKKENRLAIKLKEKEELKYWKGRKNHEGVLGNSHYEFFYTSFFRIDPSFYNGKKLLDIGCGPRGSLEWATMAKERIGLDPLANEYLKLGAKEHKMTYIDSPSEKIPFKNSYFDAVFSFNSLDHVFDVGQTLNEIKRVVRKGGIFLLMVEVNHPPKECEPHKISPKELVEELKSSFDNFDLKVFRPVEDGMYSSIKSGGIFPDPFAKDQIGWLTAKFVRK